MRIRPRHFGAACTAAVAAMLLISAGCRPKVQPAPKGYFGPTQSLNDVVARINANNERLPTLWTRHRFGADIVEQTKTGRTKTTSIGGRGVIMYQAPDRMVMTGTESLIGKIFEIGCNDAQYWLGVPQEKVATIWHGRMEHLDKPCVQPIPIRPDLLMEVLGVFAIDPNFMRFPAPVMRFNHDQDAYMLTWIKPQGGRFAAVKEVWYDRKTMRPRLVNLFDGNGRVLLRAYLSQHKQVEMEGVAESERPYVAGRYQLLFTDNGTRMTIELEDVRLSYKGAPEARSFRRPKLDNYATQIQLDEACGD